MYTVLLRKPQEKKGRGHVEEVQVDTKKISNRILRM
jgi:hypothetical protein